MQASEDIYSEAREASSAIMIVSAQSGTAFRFTPWTEDSEIPYNSVAVIGLEGPITKYNQFCGPVGMLTKAAMLQRADSNDRIKAILLNIDSPGGEVYAGFTMADAIQKTNKPVISFVRDLSASAAHMIASVSDEIYVNSDMATIGSLGTYATILDVRQQLEKEGIRLHEIYASASVDKNREYREAINGNYGPLQERINAFNDRFMSIVKTGREGKLTADEKTWGTGKLYFGTEALKLGLIDGILSYEETLQTIFENLI
jgi:signal peptide peptidase SppA